MAPAKGTATGVTLAGTLPGQQANTLVWSPAGKFLVMAGLKAMNGQLCFFSADEFEVRREGGGRGKRRDPAPPRPQPSPPP